MSTAEMTNTDQALDAEASQALDWARGLEITTHEEHAAASEQLATVKGLASRIANYFLPMKRKAHDAHAEICKKEREALNPLQEAEGIAKQKLLTFARAEEAKRLAEQRRLQAEIDERARKEREKHEQEAARQRAIEEAARRKAAEARAEEERIRREAEAASQEERKRLLREADERRKEAEKQERARAAAQVKVEAKEDAAALVTAPVVQIAAAPKIAGQSTRRTWKAEITNLQTFLEAAAAAKRFDLLLPNQKMLDAMAKGMNERAAFEGVRFFQEESLATKAK